MKHQIHLFASFILVLFMTGCTNLSVFVANIPAYFDGSKVYKDIVFQKNYNLALDIYMPPESVPVKPQTIVFFYGGSWEGGHKEQYRFLGSALSNKGYIVFIPDYRKYPTVKFPDFMFDAADAVKWVNAHVAEYGGKQRSLVLMGHSAGANIATLLITDKSYLKNDYKSISAGISLSGAYDFTPNTDNLKSIFGPPEKYPLMRPITFVDGDEPPLFLAHGKDDDIVASFNFEHMRDKLRKKNVCVVSKEYESFGHINTIGEFSWVGGKQSVMIQDVLDFLKNNESKATCKN